MSIGGVSLVVALLLAACSSQSTAASTASCSRSRWIGAWEAPPSDASHGDDISDSVNPPSSSSASVAKPNVKDETIRARFSPTVGGSIVRVQLSNRFGTAPITLLRSSIALGGKRASLTGVPRALRFGGQRAVTISPGSDVWSDPVALRYRAFDVLAVSSYLGTDIGMPTEHYVARQTSYLSADGSGDHVADRSGAAFVESTITRPLVTGLDVKTAATRGAVVALGDSITDGYQGRGPTGVPESQHGLDANLRYPDDLARRLRSRGIPLSVLNAGISGNRILRDGGSGMAADTAGSSALRRLRPDVLSQAGVSSVIWMEGINDIGLNPHASAAQIISGLRVGIDRLHRAGIRVLLGTLTPSGGNIYPGYGGSAAATVRSAVNRWIRRSKLPDAVVDFDAALRDRSKRDVLRAAYDDGDHLHLSAAGYQAMADAVPLHELAIPAC